jgi:Zn-dependent protease
MSTNLNDHKAEQIDELSSLDSLERAVIPRRRLRFGWRTAIILFFLTALTMFWAGVSNWLPIAPLTVSQYWGSLMPARQVILAHWSDGLIYTIATLSILLAHEMGHYLMTLKYKVPATPPLFLPMPLSPLGTFGAVIGMDGRQADRREVFDIGIAGPLAGLAVALPILIIGVMTPTNRSPLSENGFAIGHPLVIQWIADFFREGGASSLPSINSEINPWLMAGWTGLLVTGLNMVPMGQLDGGHVTFGLVGPKSVWIARLFLLLAIGFMIYSQQAVFILMLVLVVISGLRHPSTRDDTATLTPLRFLIGWPSLVLPFICLPYRPITVL